MSDLGDKIFKLTKQFFPTGRAFKIAEGSEKEKLIKALIISEEAAVNDALSIKNSILPDNAGFTADDATDWERRLGLASSPLVPLNSRKAAILQKLRAPGANPAKGNYRYLEEQLQLAGFNVFVFENRFPDYPNGWITQTPLAVSGAPGILKKNQYGQFQYGQRQYGARYNNLCVNFIDEARDNNFNIGGNFKMSFFVGGNPVGTFANVPAVRKEEFRQLIIRIKPVQAVGFLFINYI